MTPERIERALEYAEGGQVDLFDGVKLENAESLLRRFLDWHDAGCILGPDRVVLIWFANDVREYFEAPTCRGWADA